MISTEVLYVAAQDGNLDLLKAELGRMRNEDPALKTPHPETGAPPLFAAAQFGHLECVRLLITAGAPINQAAEPSCNKMTALHIAVQQGHTAVVELLLEKGAEVDTRRDNQFTPLLTAVEKQNVEITKVLVAKKASIELAQADGAASLHIACTLGNAEILTILLSQAANVNQTMPDGAWPLFIAAKAGYADCVALLLKNSGDPNMRTNLSPLHLAARFGHAAVVRQLLAAGVSANTMMEAGGEDGMRISPLMFAAREGRMECVQVLVEEGSADLDIGFEDDTSAFVLASACEHTEVANYLIGRGAKPPQDAES